MRYFTIRQGALVTRFGTGTYLGATLGVHQDGPKKGATFVDWHEGEVVMLPDAEVGKYLREYNQLLLEGSIAESTEEAWKAFHVEREAAVEAEAVKLFGKPDADAPAEDADLTALDAPAEDAETEDADEAFDADEADSSKGSQE